MKPVNTQGNMQDDRVGLWDLFILVLSVYVLLAMFFEVVLDLSSDTRQLLQFFDTGICFVFLGDFFYRFWVAPKKWAFLKWGWIDLLSSIPALDAMRAGRLIRIIRVLRLLRGVRSMKVFYRVVFQNRAQTALTTVTVFVFSMIVFATIAILYVEISPDANIKNAQDALWWAMATVATVGYGDKYPISGEGQIIAVLLMVTGLGAFSTMTGYVSSFFVEEDIDEQDEEMDKQTKEILEKLNRMETLLLDLQKEMEERSKTAE